MKPSGVGTALRSWLKATSILAIGGNIILTPLTENDATAFWPIYLLVVAASVAMFVLSIIHLVKYQEKGLAVTMLVFSSFYVLAILVGVVAGLMGAAVGNVP